MPDEDLGRIWVGQLPGSGALYALPASYYEFDFPEGADPCPPKGAGKGDKDANPACEGRSLPASAWDGDGRWISRAAMHSAGAVPTEGSVRHIRLSYEA
jgi:hypothetical protein